MIERVYIGFGSNLGNRNENFKTALNLLREKANVLRVAQLVESAPVDGVEGGNFLNTAIECELMSDAHSFMIMLQEIEHKVGGKTEKLGGARTCDLDILLWGDEVIDLPDLRVPHPRLHLRDFYLIPLCELLSDERHPLIAKTFAELRAGVKVKSVTEFVAA